MQCLHRPKYTGKLDFFYGPLYLTVTCSALVSPEKYRKLFREMTSGAVSAFLVRQRIHELMRLSTVLRKIARFSTCRWTSDPKVDTLRCAMPGSTVDSRYASGSVPLDVFHTFST